jgi:hypothetical protein
MLIAALVALLLCLPQAQSPDPHPLAGEWEGAYATAVSDGTLWLKVGRANGEWSIALKATSPSVAEPAFQPASAVAIDGNTVSFVVNWGTPVTFKGALEGDALRGEMSGEHWSRPGTWSVTRAGAP